MIFICKFLSLAHPWFESCDFSEILSIKVFLRLLKGGLSMRIVYTNQTLLDLYIIINKRVVTLPTILTWFFSGLSKIGQYGLPYRKWVVDEIGLWNSYKDWHSLVHDSSNYTNNILLERNWLPQYIVPVYRKVYMYM